MGDRLDALLCWVFPSLDVNLLEFIILDKPAARPYIRLSLRSLINPVSCAIRQPPCHLSSGRDSQLILLPLSLFCNNPLFRRFGLVLLLGMACFTVANFHEDGLSVIGPLGPDEVASQAAATDNVAFEMDSSAAERLHLFNRMRY